MHIAAALVAAFSLAGCDSKVADPDRPMIARVTRGGPNEMDVWRDRETGCEYISYTSSAGLSPRLDETGWPVCRKGREDTSCPAAPNEGAK